MFSSPRPEYVTPSAQNTLLSQILEDNDGNSQLRMIAEISSPLAPMNEPTGKAIGFFEQGLLTGGGVAVASIIIGLAVVVRFAVPVVMRRLR